MDFTISIYKKLLDWLSKQSCSFQSILNFIENQDSKTIILRHDVDQLPQNALEFARIEQEMGINGTYFFRIVKGSFDPRVVEEIAGMGHEVGYHYEDLSLAAKSMGHGAWSRGRRGKDEVTKGRSDSETMRLGDDETVRGGDYVTERLRDKGTGRLWDDQPSLKLRLTRETKGLREEDPATSNQQPAPVFQKAIELFDKHLTLLRRHADISTICMHGSPRSRWDSRLLWKYYDYRDFGIIGEPYFDVNFEDVLYLTDTGRRWDGREVSVRDRVVGRKEYVVGSGEILRGGNLETKGLSDGVTEGRGDFETKRLRDEETERFGEDNRKLFHDWKVKPIPGSLMNPTPKTIAFQNKYNFRHTRDIIRAAENNELPDKIMMTFHPQRWTDRTVPWFRELVMQNVKNVAKYFLIRLRD